MEGTRSKCKAKKNKKQAQTKSTRFWTKQKSSNCSRCCGVSCKHKAKNNPHILHHKRKCDEMYKYRPMNNLSPLHLIPVGDIGPDVDRGSEVHKPPPTPPRRIGAGHSSGP